MSTDNPNPIPSKPVLPPVPEAVAAHLDDLREAHEVTAAKADANAAKLNDWSALLSTPLGKVVAGLGTAAALFLTSWLTGLTDGSKKISDILKEATIYVNVTNWPDAPAAAVAAPPKRTVYLLAKSTDAARLKSLPPGVVERYEDGSTYGPDAMPLPVVVTRDAGGNDLDVRKLP